MHSRITFYGYAKIGQVSGRPPPSGSVTADDNVLVSVATCQCRTTANCVLTYLPPLILPTRLLAKRQNGGSKADYTQHQSRASSGVKLLLRIRLCNTKDNVYGVDIMTMSLRVREFIGFIHRVTTKQQRISAIN